jgi:nitroreductase
MTGIQKLSFEQTIKTRSSTRNFSKEFPPINIIEEIVKSALYAPYGGGSKLPYNEIRKIYILKQNTKAMTNARETLLEYINKTSNKVDNITTLVPFLKNKFRSFSDKLHSIDNNGIPSLFDAPYYIIIAEKRMFPPVQKQSIAHSLQNMWLTATNLGLGFQLVFMTSQMSYNKEFLSILNLPKGDYIIDGCVVGYPKVHNEVKKEFELGKFVNWIE